jgi:hypothetical protein
LGGQISCLKVGSVSSNLGFGVKGDYALSDKNMVTFGFNYYMPKSNSSATTGYSFSSSTTLSSRAVSVGDKIGFMQFYVGRKRCFVG